MAVDKKNIFLSHTAAPYPYSSDSHSMTKNYPQRNPVAHAAYIQRKLSEAYAAHNLTQSQVAAIRYKDGIYLEVSGAAGHDLETQGLESPRQGIRLVNIKKDPQTQTETALVYIPNGKESYLIKKIESYANERTAKNHPRYNELVSSIEDIRLALFKSFWFDSHTMFPDEEPVWCELWLRFGEYDKSAETWDNAEKTITSICQDLNILINENRIVFPERLVKLIYANANDLRALVESCSFIAEMHRAPEPTAFFTELSNPDQKDWADELLSRTTFEHENVAVCLLDTGLNSAHPLLTPATDKDHIQSVDASWRTNDHHGHGTEMAGVSLYYDLKQALLSKSPLKTAHEIESVKILPPTGENPPELYGAITAQAVALAEIANPMAKRVLCMAVTAPAYNTRDGSPTSWSAAIDNITSGAEENDEKRLFVISAGNVQPNEFGSSPYPEANRLHSVESPGQSWNAITVGAYSDDSTISDPVFHGFTPLAKAGALSPYSSTSSTWDKKWPIKPEVLFNGGNVASNGTDYDACSDLSLLTTNYQPLRKLFSTIWATSAATAQAAYFCAQLLSEYPDIWPETARALMIHSASWTQEMKAQFCTEDAKSKGRRDLLHTCGYGIPNLAKAMQCMNNSVNMVIQGELQPFDKKSMHEMHLHTLPWPKEVLEELGETPVTLKLTLSYFIEPGPGEVGWKDKYRYPSCGLRFDVINSNETKEDFQKRINVKMRGDNKKDKGDGTSGSDRWYLGASNRDVGSIHSDFCELSAVELSGCNLIAVYPVVGWWRERDYLKRYDKNVRYSLVVSLSTPSTDVDLYTPIITQITPAIEIPIPTQSSS
mgnify:FL=1